MQTTETERPGEWAHTIFKCGACSYETRDTMTAGTINDLLVDCPSCGIELIPGDPDTWCHLDGSCGWYAQ